MPALNFQKQFVKKVKSGEKKQSVRAMRKRPFKIGDTLYLYTGMRTKSCEKLGESTCTHTANVEILKTGSLIIEGIIMTRHTRNKFAKADGFDNWNEMWNWIKDTHGFPFHGQLIKW